MTDRMVSVAAKTIALGLPAAIALALSMVPQVLAASPPAEPPAPPMQAAPGPDTVSTRQVVPGNTVQLIFSPWTRYCATGLASKSSEIRTKDVCFTAADGHLPSGQKIVIALLIEPEGSDTKLLRVTLPLGVALVPGARIVIDGKETITAPYEVCLPKNGCMADYKADADLIAKLKNGQTLAIQAFDKGKPISFTLPLADFAKAHDGPPSDPAGLDELQRQTGDHLDLPTGK